MWIVISCSLTVLDFGYLLQFNMTHAAAAAARTLESLVVVESTASSVAVLRLWLSCCQ